MKRIHRLVVLAAMALGQAVRAQETTPRYQLADELLSAMEVQKTIEQSFAAVREMQVAQIRNMNLGEANTEKAQAVQAKVMDLLSKEMSWDNIKKDYIAIYAETFTEGELKGLVEFYESPAGRKFVEKTPELMKKSMTLTQKQMADMLPKIQEIAKEATQQTAPPPPPSGQPGK